MRSAVRLLAQLTFGTQDTARLPSMLPSMRLPAPQPSAPSSAPSSHLPLMCRKDASFYLLRTCSPILAPPPFPPRLSLAAFCSLSPDSPTEMFSTSLATRMSRIGLLAFSLCA